MFLFQAQKERRHTLKSLLITLSLSPSLESRHIKSLIWGFVRNARVYVSNQKSRGWLRKQGEYLVLTPRARRLVQSLPMDLVAGKKLGGKLKHEILLARCLFACLLHLDFTGIRSIKKQKSIASTSLVPDLTITTATNNLYIEVDTGTQTLKTVEAKIGDYTLIRPEGEVIYFTNSTNHFSHFYKHPDVRFVYLGSQTLAEDIQQLTLTSTSTPTTFNQANYKLTTNVSVCDPSLLNYIHNQDKEEEDFEELREETLKLLGEDY